MSDFIGIPKGCEKYNNGLPCEFKRCKYIHCSAEREEAIQRLKREHAFKSTKAPATLELINESKKNDSQYTKQNIPLRYIKNNSPITIKKQNYSQYTNHNIPPGYIEQNSPTPRVVQEVGITEVRNSVIFYPKQPRQPPPSDICMGLITVQNRVKLGPNKSHLLPAPKTRPESSEARNELVSRPKEIPDTSKLSQKELSKTKTVLKNLSVLIESSAKENYVPKLVTATPKREQNRNFCSNNSDSAVRPVKESSNLQSFLFVKRSLSKFFRPKKIVPAPTVDVTCPNERSAPTLDITNLQKRPATKQLEKVGKYTTLVKNSYDELDSIKEPQADITRNFRSREVIDTWDPLRLQWVDNLSPKNRQTYLEDATVIVDGKPVRTISYKIDALLAALSKSQGEQFKRFLDLPAEIRNQIWRYAKYNISNTCYVKLDVKQMPGSAFDLVKGKLQPAPSLITDAKFSYLFNVPGLFGACRESRSIVSDVYGEARIFAFNRLTMKPFRSGRGSCRFCFERDRLFLITRGSITQLPECVELMKDEERVQIRHLAIPFKDYFHEPRKVVLALLNLPSLQTLDLVMGDGKEDLEQIGNIDYSYNLEHYLKKQRRLDDLELNENDRNKWTIPKVRRELVNEVQARLWGIDCLKWDKTSRPIP